LFRAQDRDQLMMADGKPEVRISRLTDGRPTGSLPNVEGPVTSVSAAVLRGVPALASGGADGVITLWDPENYQQIHRFPAHENWVNALCSLTVGDRTLLVSAGGDRAVMLWDLESGRSLRRTMDWLRGRRARLSAHQGWVLSLAAVDCPGGPLLASGGADRMIWLWDPRTGKPSHGMDGHSAAVSSLCTVEVGGRTVLISASLDKTVQAWDPLTGQPLYELYRGSGPIRGLCRVEVGGRTLVAIGGADRMVRLWDLAAGTQEAVIPVHHTVYSLLGFPDGFVAGLSRGVVAISLNGTF
jgi:WD40 repeat protein